MGIGHLGETKKLTPSATNHSSFAEDDASFTYRLVSTDFAMYEIVAPPGSLGIGKIMSLVNFMCSSTGDDEYGRLDTGTPNTEGGRHVKREGSDVPYEFETPNVACPGVTRENAASDENCKFNHDDTLTMYNMCAVHFAEYTFNVRIKGTGIILRAASPSIRDVPGASLFTLCSMVDVVTHYPAMGPMVKTFGIEAGATEFMFMPLLSPGELPTLSDFTAHVKTSGECTVDGCMCAHSANIGRTGGGHGAGYCTESVHMCLSAVCVSDGITEDSEPAYDDTPNADTFMMRYGAFDGTSALC